MNIDNAIAPLEAALGDSRQGHPEEVFLFVSRITPLINVDLLIQDERGRTLLTWSDDEFFGQSWHIPGGIIPYEQTLVLETIRFAFGHPRTGFPDEPFCQPGSKVQSSITKRLWT